VSTAGSIDWLCLPRFDSPAAFAALLHNDEAGHWALAPAGASTYTNRRYVGNTLVLETDWVTADGAVRVIDFMPPRAGTPHLVRIAMGRLQPTGQERLFQYRTAGSGASEAR
jgi:GH15 family glucan-1,4-alpha-glucosidase